MNEEHWKDVDANYSRWRQILTMKLKTGRTTDKHSVREADQQKRALVTAQTAQRQSTRAWVNFDEGKNKRTQRNPESDRLIETESTNNDLRGKRHDCFFDSWKKYSTGYSQMPSQPYINPVWQGFHFLEQTRGAASFWLQAPLPIPSLAFLILKLPASKWTWLR